MTTDSKPILTKWTPILTEDGWEVWEVKGSITTYQSGSGTEDLIFHVLEGDFYGESLYEPSDFYETWQQARDRAVQLAKEGVESSLRVLKLAEESLGRAKMHAETEVTIIKLSGKTNGRSENASSSGE